MSRLAQIKSIVDSWANDPAPLSDGNGYSATAALYDIQRVLQEKNAVHFSSATEEWGTHPSFIEEVNAKWPIGLDVCATPNRQVCANYFAPKAPDGRWPVINPAAIDGLKQTWHHYLEPGKVAWMNPPYGRVIKTWVKKAYEEAFSIDRKICVLGLLPSRTDTKWWHSYIAPVANGRMPGKVIFLEGRLSFIDATGKVQDPAPFPSVLVVWGSL